MKIRGRVERVALPGWMPDDRHVRVGADLVYVLRDCSSLQWRIGHHQRRVRKDPIRCGFAATGSARRAWTRGEYQRVVELALFERRRCGRERVASELAIQAMDRARVAEVIRLP